MDVWHNIFILFFFAANANTTLFQTEVSADETELFQAVNQTKWADVKDKSARK